MYARTLKLYKGIDNEVKFEVKNQEQQATDITDYSFSVSLVDDKGNATLYKDAVVLDPIKGVITVVFTEMELANMEATYFTYNIIGTDPAGKVVPLYIDDNWGARGQAQVLAGHYPTVKPSIEVTIGPGNPTAFSSYLQSENTTHTAQVFLNQFTGTITVQATLDPVPVVSALTANWTDISSTEYDTATGTSFIVTEGVYTAVRYKITTLAGSVTKVLYRN